MWAKAPVRDRRYFGGTLPRSYQILLYTDTHTPTLGNTRFHVDRQREFLPDNHHQLAIYGRIIERIQIQRSLIQSERLDCRLINCSGNEQAVITLKIGKGRSRLHVKRASYRTAVVARLLQCLLNVRNDLIG